MGLWHDLFHRRSEQAGASNERQLAREQMLASLLVMAWVVEARDPYTGGHLWRVSRYAELLAEQAGLPADQAARVSIGGFLHDLGKVGIPDAILNKPDRLSPDEYAVIRTHPEVGARMLAGHPLSDLVHDCVLQHHETPDGTGYPRGIRAPDIPLGPRIVGICDAFDAMTSARSYRAAMPTNQALSIIRAGLGRQFDAVLGEQFLALGSGVLLDHIRGHSDDGIPLQECVMCGPTLVARRESRPGDALYCRNCGSQYRLESLPGQGLLAKPTGEKGRPSDVEPVADLELISRFVQDTARRAFKLAT